MIPTHDDERGITDIKAIKKNLFLGLKSLFFGVGGVDGEVKWLENSEGDNGIM